METQNINYLETTYQKTKLLSTFQESTIKPHQESWQKSSLIFWPILSTRLISNSLSLSTPITESGFLDCPSSEWISKTLNHQNNIHSFTVLIGTTLIKTITFLYNRNSSEISSSECSISILKLQLARSTSIWFLTNPTVESLLKNLYQILAPFIHPVVLNLLVWTSFTWKPGFAHHQTIFSTSIRTCVMTTVLLIHGEIKLQKNALLVL